MGVSEKMLVFCDTFSHEGEEGELHVDLVKFSPPVVVQEVRIIPQNIPAHANTIELDKKGLTRPSSFSLDVYISDSTNPLAPNFDHIGGIDYKPGTISLECNPKNPSDQVVVKGLYAVLTVAIYGVVSSPFFGQSPSPRKRSASPFSNSDSGLSDNEKRERRSLAEGGDGKAGFELFEPFSPVNSPDHLFELSDEEIMPSKRTTSAAGGYEELSDEEVSFDGDFDPQEGVDSYYGEEGWLTSGVGFNPYQCELTKLEFYNLSVDTPHELLMEKLHKSDTGSKRGSGDEASRLRDVILKRKDHYQSPKWVETLEEIPSFLYPGLAQLEHKSGSEGKELMLKLVTWTLQCLDLDAARKMPIAYNIRYLKAGLRLVPAIASLGRKCSSALVKHSVMEKLCELLEANQMASTLKLLVLRAMDSLLDYPQGMERFLGWSKHHIGGAEKLVTPYQKILELLLSQPSSRVCRSATALLKKSAIAELSGELQEIVEKIIELTPIKPHKSPPPSPSVDLYNLYGDMGTGAAAGKTVEVKPEGEVLDEDGTAAVRVTGGEEAEASQEEKAMEQTGSGGDAVDVVGSEAVEEEVKMEGQDGIPEVAEVAETVTVEQEEGKVGETGSPDLVERGEALLDQGVEVARQGVGLAREAAEIVEQGIGMVKEGIDMVEQGETSAGEGTEHVQTEGEGQEPMDEDDTPGFVLSEGDVKRIVSILEELKNAIENAKHTTVQPPVKCFPTATRTYPLTDEVEYFSPLARIMFARRVPECLLVLLTAPSTSVELGVFAAVRDLLLLFLTTQEGLVFLSSKPTVMVGMVRTVTQQALDDSMLPLTDFLRHGDEECLESCSAHNLGLLLNYHLQALLSLDTLRKASKLNMSELESAECIGALHTLYSMVLTPIGKCAVSYILALSDNILTLVPFIEPRKQRDHDVKLTKSSVSSRYVAILIIQLLKSSVRFDFLFRYGAQLLSAAEFFKDNSSPLMSDLYNWLSPVKELVASEGVAKVIVSMVNVVKEKIPSISCNKPGKAGFPITTAIKLLLAYITPPREAKGAQKEAKWGLSLLHLFSANAMDTLLSLLNKFYDVLLPVWSQRQSLSVSQASTLFSLATVALQLLRQLLGGLIEGEDFQFRDMRVASTLLKLHTVLCSAPYSAVATNAAPEIQVLIVGVLSMCTKPGDILPEGEEQPDLSKNCWCLMLKEVFDHTLSCPQNFLSGLMVLSELLPLPLPTPTLQSVSDGGKKLSYHRKLWGLHLDPYMSSISYIVQNFLACSSNDLQQMLRRVCAQLADINADLATLVTQQIISNLLVEIEKQMEREEPESVEATSEPEPAGEEKGSGEVGAPDKEEKVEQESQGAGETGGEQKVLNSPLLRHLSMCAVLCQQPAVKITLLDLISQRETASTKGFSRFIPLLVFLVQKKETPIQHKLCIMSILNALCSTFVALNTDEVEDSPMTDQQLSDCLPSRTKLDQITSAVLSHVTSPDSPLATMMLGLKVILSLCQYDAGLLNLYRYLPTHVRGFSLALERLTKAISSGSPPSADTISCVSLILQLLGLLLSSEVTGREELPDLAAQNRRKAMEEEKEEGEEDDDEEEEEEMKEEQSTSGSESSRVRERHYEVRTVGFPKSLLKVMVAGENGDLLGELRGALEVSCKDDTTLLADFDKMIATLEQEFSTVEAAVPDMVRLEHGVLPPMQRVETQFELRNVFSRSLNPPSPDFWMTSPPNDETELEPDMVTRDLQKLASQNCTGLNLEEELKKRLLPSPPHTPPHTDRKRKIALTGPEAQKRLREAIQQRMLQGPKRDMFRLRKQNTSRPPSMHVDDFMAKSSRSGRSLRDMDGLPDGGRGPPFPYMTPQAGMFLSQMGLGGRWPGSAVPSGLGYPRRDLGGSMRGSWNPRGLPQAFLSAPQPAATLRNVSMYSALQAYSRSGGNSGRGPILWPSSTKSSASSRLGDSSGGGTHKTSRHSVYKRLV